MPRLAALPVLVLCLLAADRAAAGGSAYEAERVKAEFVERFTRFIEWPGEAEAPPGPFVLGLFGEGPVAASLERMAATRRLRGRPLEVRRLATPEGVTACHAVWIAGSRSGDLAGLLALTAGRPILTLGDTDGYGTRGVILNLRPAGRHLRFEVNLHEARRSGLKLSSKLLRLGTVVGPPIEAGP